MKLTTFILIFLSILLLFLIKYYAEIMRYVSIIMTLIKVNGKEMIWKSGEMISFVEKCPFQVAKIAWSAYREGRDAVRIAYDEIYSLARILGLRIIYEFINAIFH